MQIEKLRAYEIEKSMPGTNAVFKAGNYVIKIYPPVDSGLNGILDMENEARITRSINAIGVESPCIVANGIIKDKYDFVYIIMNYIEGLPFRIAVKSMSDMEKELIGVKLRDITNKLNVLVIILAIQMFCLMWIGKAGGKNTVSASNEKD